MERGQYPPPVERLEFAQPLLWGAAILFFGVGDVVTTSIGLAMSGIYEAGPVTGLVIAHHGLIAMVPVKIGVLAGCYALWRFTPHPHRVGVPFGLAMLGVLVVSWNVFVKLLVILA